MVRTTLDIPEDLMSDVRRLSEAKTKREAVVAAMEEYVRQREQQEFLDLLGTFRYHLTQEDLRKLRGDDE